MFALGGARILILQVSVSRIALLFLLSRGRCQIAEGSARSRRGSTQLRAVGDPRLKPARKGDAAHRFLAVVLIGVLCLSREHALAQ